MNDLEPRKMMRLTGDDDFDEALNKCAQVLEVKGKDYTIGNTDRMHNFKTAASNFGITPLQSIGLYMYKHMAAVMSYIKSGGQNESEPIEMRIVDNINYLLFLYKMVQEEKRSQNVKEPEKTTIIAGLTYGCCDFAGKKYVSDCTLADGTRREIEGNIVLLSPRQYTNMKNLSLQVDKK